ncbi:MAG: low molecular weight protein-tyrosine-phosphatase [Lachnospiraceae bacterium]|nr:low molecular weight protein-tyrosine-phosphatase [Lachnospiraceae bacterium]
MIRILFICHGNICRSPMAEFVMKDLVTKAGIEDLFHIESAATSSEEIWGNKGNPVYPPARRKLMEHGIDPGGKRARRTVREDYDRFDVLIGMDHANIRNMKRIYGGDPDAKVSLLLDHCGRYGQEVADPWYTDNFDETWDDVLRGCTALLAELM